VDREGVMGRSIFGNLSRRGYAVNVHSRSAQRPTRSRQRRRSGTTASERRRRQRVVSPRRFPREVRSSPSSVKDGELEDAPRPGVCRHEHQRAGRQRDRRRRASARRPSVARAGLGRGHRDREGPPLVMIGGEPASSTRSARCGRRGKTLSVKAGRRPAASTPRWSTRFLIATG